jgi:hypothetical protein
VSGLHIAGGVEAKERSALAGGFESGAGSGFFALDEADGGDDTHACFAGGFDGCDGGGSGGADVVDDENRGVLFAEPFDAAAGAVGLFCLADEEAVDQGRAGLRLSAPCAGDGDCGDDGISAQGESADGRGVEVVLAEQVEDGEAREASALGVEGGGAAVDVVVALGAGGEGEVAETERGAGEQVEEGGAGVQIKPSS